ncbi:enoyl-CoA hydratase/isomerase family protein [Actinoplanes sp. LDG1-06]|uniref:Enoyl-CoA hydratase/isomerase family protein n=1 Tax=Paractinoplanes ovalisporus TaxID=2810368 RepID=A0ABS2A8S3_9ACTN|nr:enoyl-CoA hydratase-related protein [Actinoplanes ovalisporus]MBM2615713.1 enoyl-CoA hydratase/isomerase family protein [Actinoplanes ovalisporus]
MTFLTVETAAGVATVVIDRPPANAVNPELIEEFLEVVPKLSEDPAVRCIVLTGVGRFFIAGADIAVMRDLSLDNHVKMRRWIEVQRLLELAPKPVVAALNGHALGGGAELSLACDLRIAAASASFGFPEMQLGLFPGAGGSQRLPRLLGLHRAKLLMIEGRRLTAAEAFNLGLVDEVVPDDEFAEVVAVRAGELAAKPTATIGLLKTSMLEGAPLDMDGAMAVEWAAVQRVIASEDAAEGLQSFLDKRKPEFRGR